MRATRAATLILLAACSVKRDAEPRFSRIELTGAVPGETVERGQEIDLRIFGEELWDRAVTVDAHRVTEPAGAESVVLSKTATFDAQVDEQVATTSFTIARELLAAQGRSELFFVARFQGEEIRSDSVFVEVDSSLQRFELVDQTEGSEVSAGDQLTLEIEGTDLWDQPIQIEVIQEGTETSEVVDRLTATFDAAEPVQTARATWTVGGPFLGTAGRHDFFFRARVRDLSIDSVSLFVDVVTNVASIRLFRVGSNGEREVQAGEFMRIGETLRAEAEGLGLVGVPVELALFADGAPDERLGTETVEATSNQVEASFLPEPTDPSDTVVLYVQATAGASIRRSPEIELHRWGITRCIWFVGGEEAAPNARHPSGTDVELVAETWGFEGRSGSFEIFESDSVDDDYVVTLDGQVIDGVVRIPWTAYFKDDGVFNGEAEYYFVGRIENRVCDSPKIEIEKP